MTIYHQLFYMSWTLSIAQTSMLLFLALGFFSAGVEGTNHFPRVTSSFANVTSTAPTLTTSSSALNTLDASSTSACSTCYFAAIDEGIGPAAPINLSYIVWYTKSFTATIDTVSYYVTQYNNTAITSSTTIHGNFSTLDESQFPELLELSNSMTETIFQPYVPIRTFGFVDGFTTTVTPGGTALPTPLVYPDNFIAYGGLQYAAENCSTAADEPAELDPYLQDFSFNQEEYFNVGPETDILGLFHNITSATQCPPGFYEANGAVQLFEEQPGLTNLSACGLGPCWGPPTVKVPIVTLTGTGSSFTTVNGIYTTSTSTTSSSSGTTSRSSSTSSSGTTSSSFSSTSTPGKTSESTSSSSTSQISTSSPSQGTSSSNDASPSSNAGSTSRTPNGSSQSSVSPENTTPTPGSITPSAGNTTPSAGGTTPATGNTTPVTGNTTPAAGNIIPTAGNNTPGGGSKASGQSVSSIPLVETLSAVSPGSTQEVTVTLQTTVLAELVIGGTTYTESSSSVFVIGSVTVTPGGSGFVISGTSYSIEPSATGFVIGGTTTIPISSETVTTSYLITPSSGTEYSTSSTGSIGSSTVTPIPYNGKAGKLHMIGTTWITGGVVLLSLLAVVMW